MAEILAPAGAMEQVTAAVRCGADAVYMGAGFFNARRNAVNFDAQTLPQAVSYCHGRGVKVYVTMNTLIMDDERERFEQEAELAAASGADAVIIQDLSVLRFFREHYPSLPCHASTQTAVHNADGARLLEELGFTRLVLARELTLSEMEKICSAVSISAEAFVHGAHCMSVSGACYLSAMLGGRSGNRGLCAQPCRLDWRCGREDHVLSLKDMSLIPHMREMAEAGVDSFKIEGRMKRPEYVAAAVTACRASLEGREYDGEALRSVFSRSGFTDGYLTGKRNKDMFGYRTKEDVTGASEKLLGSLRSLYRAETPRVAVDMRFAADAGGCTLTLSDGERSCTVQGGVPEAARNKPLDAASAGRSLEKLGGTPFLLRDFSAEIAPGLMLPASALNSLRRDAAEALLREREQIRAHERVEREASVLPVHGAPAEPELWARFYEAAQIPAGMEYARIILPAEKITSELIRKYGGRLIAELPCLLFPQDEAVFDEKLAALRDAGLREVWTDNLYGITLGKRLGLTVRGGSGLNILNAQALHEYELLGLASATVSFELAMGRARELGGMLPRGIIAYGRLPLMYWRSCPVRAFSGCGGCNGAGKLIDRMGVEFPVECTEKRSSALLNSVPLHIAQRDLRGFDYLLLRFSRESAEECRRITEDYRLRRGCPGEHTGGLYYRELQ